MYMSLTLSSPHRSEVGQLHLKCTYAHMHVYVCALISLQGTLAGVYLILSPFSQVETDL